MSELREDRWLSQFLAYPAFQLDLKAGTEPLSLPSDAFVAAKVSPTQVQEIRWLLHQGFSNMDTLVTLERAKKNADTAVPEIELSWANRENVTERQQVMELASSAFLNSRFFRDPKFGIERAAAIKSAWAAGFFSGERGDGLALAKRDGVVAGFLLAIKQATCLIIDLIAVAPQFQRQGISKALMAFCENQWSDVTTVRVGTQWTNETSLRAYLRQGFNIVESKYVFHRHSTSMGSNC